MHKQRTHRDIAGETAYPDWGTVTPVARVSTQTFGFKRFALFRTSARPLQVEIVSNGKHQVVAIPDLQGQIVGRLSMVFMVGVLVFTWLRRST